MSKTASVSCFSIKSNQAFFIGFLFLVIYWIVGYDGITFSDDVYYLNAGKDFWDGKMEFNDYHFSTRWGAYILSGLIGYLIGFEPHIISLISLLSYTISLFFLVKVLPKSSSAWVLVLWFCTQIYFMHFLTKVYPDGLLVIFITIVSSAALYRNSHSILAGCVLIGGLFLGFLTKETIIFLAPLPILLFYFDWKAKTISRRFYVSLVLTGIILGAVYLGYFWMKFGDPLYRLSSINAGHYISEFTYADKGFWSITRRLTILPILTFVERSYWAWIVFAIPGVYTGLKNRQSSMMEFALAFLCLFAGFWFMSSTLEFYNPIYLNPRHLIILVPILAFLIAAGWNTWNKSIRWKRLLASLIGLGVLISIVQLDLKMAVFQLGLIGVIFLSNYKYQAIALIVILVTPALIAIPYQQNLKQYPTLIKALSKESQKTTGQSLLITNNFLDFSKNVLFPTQNDVRQKIHGLDYIFLKENLKVDTVNLFLYTYYQHAYPQEQAEIDSLINKLEGLNYSQISESNSGIIWKRVFTKQ